MGQTTFGGFAAPSWDAPGSTAASRQPQEDDAQLLVIPEPQVVKEVQIAPKVQVDPEEISGVSAHIVGDEDDPRVQIVKDLQIKVEPETRVIPKAQAVAKAQVVPEPHPNDDISSEAQEDNVQVMSDFLPNQREQVVQEQSLGQQQQASRIQDIAPPRVMDESACLKMLTTYCMYTIRKCSPLDPRKEAKGTWARAEITKEDIEQESIIELVKELNDSRRSQVDKEKALIQNQHAQVTAIIHNLTSTEQDSAFEYTIVQLDSVTRPIRLSGREMYETVNLSVFVKRGPRKHLNPVVLFNDIERMKNIKKLAIDGIRLPPQIYEQRRGSNQIHGSVKEDTMSMAENPMMSAAYKREHQDEAPRIKGASTIDAEFQSRYGLHSSGAPNTFSSESGYLTPHRHDSLGTPHLSASRNTSQLQTRPVISDLPIRSEPQDYLRTSTEQLQAHTAQLYNEAYGVASRPYSMPESSLLSARPPLLQHDTAGYNIGLEDLQTNLEGGLTNKKQWKRSVDGG
ncbi:hypothetical protein V8E51_006210 [Hyaloscypha variabilis]